MVTPTSGTTGPTGPQGVEFDSQAAAAPPPFVEAPSVEGQYGEQFNPTLDSREAPMPSAAAEELRLRLDQVGQQDDSAAATVRNYGGRGGSNDPYAPPSPFITPAEIQQREDGTDALTRDAEVMRAESDPGHQPTAPLHPPIPNDQDINSWATAETARIAADPTLNRVQRNTQLQQVRDTAMIARHIRDNSGQPITRSGPNSQLTWGQEYNRAGRAHLGTADANWHQRCRAVAQQVEMDQIHNDSGVG